MVNGGCGVCLFYDRNLVSRSASIVGGRMEVNLIQLVHFSGT